MATIALFASAGFPEMSIAERTSKSGRTVGAMGRKDYGLAHNVKGAALKREHADYLFALGKRGNVNVGAKMTGGEWLVKAVKSNNEGTKHVVTFVTAGSIGADTRKPAEIAATLTDAELMAIVEGRKGGAHAN